MALIPMRLITFLLTVLALPACTAMLLGNNSTGEAAPAASRTSTQASGDSAISGTIRQQYVADGDISRYTLGIRTASGRVTLTGTVGSYDIRDRVVDIARNTHGVISVDSRVTVNTNLE
jgi:osmotically-inducible protein OsmY